MAGSKLRNTRSKRRKTKDGRIEVKEPQNVTGSRRISPDLVQNSKYFAKEDDCFDSGQVSLVLKPKIDNAVGLESSDLRLTVEDVGSGDGRSSSGGWPGGLDSLNGKHSFYQLKKKKCNRYIKKIRLLQHQA